MFRGLHRAISWLACKVVPQVSEREKNNFSSRKHIGKFIMPASMVPCPIPANCFISVDASEARESYRTG